MNAFNTTFSGGSLVISDSVNGAIISYTLATPAATSLTPTTATLQFNPGGPTGSAAAAAASAGTVSGLIKSADTLHTIAVTVGTSGTNIIISALPIVSGDFYTVSGTLTLYTATGYSVTVPTPTGGATIAVVFQRVSGSTAVPGNGPAGSLSLSVTGAGFSLDFATGTRGADGSYTAHLTLPAGAGHTGSVSVVDEDGLTGTSGTITTQAGVTDSFVRANSAVTMGNADSGQTWTVPTGGGTWGITSDKAYAPVSGTLFAGSSSITVIDSTLSDCTVTAHTTTQSGFGFEVGVVFRETDASNYWIYTAHSTAYNLYKVVAGTPGLVSGGSVAPASNDVLSVVLSGTSITCKVNGTTDVTTTDAFNQTATKHGLETVINTAAFTAFSAQ